MSKNLLTRADFNGADFKYLTINLNDNEIDAHISEAQRLDLRPFLGVALYHALIEAYPDDAEYSKLMQGEVYEWCGDTITFDGLRFALAYYSYARYLGNQDGVSTPFGIVTKTNEFSTALSSKSLQTKVDNARAAGSAYLTEAERYLNEKRETFPLWKCSPAKKRQGGANLSVVDKGSQNRNHSSYTRKDRK